MFFYRLALALALAVDNSHQNLMTATLATTDDIQNYLARVTTRAKEIYHNTRWPGQSETRVKSLVFHYG